MQTNDGYKIAKNEFGNSPNSKAPLISSRRKRQIFVICGRNLIDPSPYITVSLNTLVFNVFLLTLKFRKAPFVVP
jgi:hypothetical protein